MTNTRISKLTLRFYANRQATDGFIPDDGVSSSVSAASWSASSCRRITSSHTVPRAACQCPASSSDNCSSALPAGPGQPANELHPTLRCPNCAPSDLWALTFASCRNGRHCCRLGSILPASPRVHGWSDGGPRRTSRFTARGGNEE